MYAPRPPSINAPRTAKRSSSASRKGTKASAIKKKGRQQQDNSARKLRKGAKLLRSSKPKGLGGEPYKEISG